jgi:hypothetical protein
MRSVAWVLAFAFIAVLPGCTVSPSASNTNISDFTLLFNPACGCLTRVDRDGAPVGDGSVRIVGEVASTGSSFSVTVTGGRQPYVLWVNGSPVRNPYASGEDVNLDAGTYAVHVTDSRGIASDVVTVVLSS